jgi:tetratricopeptide (TPR) repeat protein
MAARLPRTATPLTRTRTNRLALAVIAAPLVFLVTIAIACWPLDATWYANVGGLHELRGSPSDASLAYEHAIALDPRQPTARRRLGLLAMDDSRYADALTHLQIAFDATPDNWTTRKALGFACMWTGNTERAVRLLASLDDPRIASELDAWSYWRQTRGELDLAQRAAQVSARLREKLS